MAKNVVLSDHKMSTPCQTPVVHLTRLNDKFQSSPQLLDDGWWMDAKKHDEGEAAHVMGIGYNYSYDSTKYSGWEFNSWTEVLR